VNFFSFKRRPYVPGAAPGTLVINRESPKPSIAMMDYNAFRIEERKAEAPRDVIPYLTDGIESITWIDVHGLGDELVVRELGEIFSLHPLTLEDVVHVGQRPKTEEFDQHRFIVLRMVEVLDSGHLQTEQLAMFLGATFVVTFQEFPGDPFDPIRERLRKGRGLLRRMGPDYLMYSLLDATIDHYFPVMERFGELLEELEDEVATNPRPATLRKIHRVKSELLMIRRAIWPVRDVVNALMRDESELIKPDTRTHLRDCYDHAVQVMDMVETFRELSSGLLDIYMSSVANKTNDVMKVLTVVTTIFAPLTFIAGIYGMNFEPGAGPLSMPELKHPYGYVATIAVMILIALAMLRYFASLGWLGRTTAEEADDAEAAAGVRLPPLPLPQRMTPAHGVRVVPPPEPTPLPPPPEGAPGTQ
jgi:magnesium transporter